MINIIIGFVAGVVVAFVLMILANVEDYFRAHYLNDMQNRGEANNK